MKAGNKGLISWEEVEDGNSFDSTWEIGMGKQ